jgi:hypothetical protein
MTMAHYHILIIITIVVVFTNVMALRLSFVQPMAIFSGSIHRQNLRLKTKQHSK